jgi:hypothetical protein
MIGAAAVVRLHIDRSFIRLDVAACKKLTLHRFGHGLNISPMVITQPHIVVRLMSMPASRSNATLCLKSGQ